MKRRGSLAVVTAAVVVLLGAGQAQAAETEQRLDASAAVSASQDAAPEVGELVAPEVAGDEVTAVLSDEAEVSLPVDGGEVAVSAEGLPDLAISLPAEANVQAAEVDATGAVVYAAESTGDSAVVVEPLTTGQVSIQTVIPNADASVRYTYELGKGTSALPREDGGLSLLVTDEESGMDMLAGEVAAPWAFDATGAPVPTHYEVGEGSFTQVVEFTAETAFPVVADPTYGHTYGVPTAYLSRAETKKAAGDINGAGLICGAIGLWNAPAGFICAANLWLVNDAAKRAVKANKCIKLVFNVTGNPLPMQFTCQR